MPSHIPGKSLIFKATNIWINNRQTLSAFSADSHDLESPGNHRVLSINEFRNGRITLYLLIKLKTWLFIRLGHNKLCFSNSRPTAKHCGVVEILKKSLK